MTTSQEKLRAVFLATLVALSMFGGAIAFGGSAAAAAGNLSGPSDYVSADDQVTITADAGNSNDLTFGIDADDNGQVGNTEEIDTVTPTDGSASVTFTPSDYGVSSTGSYTVAVVEESNADGTDDTSNPWSTNDGATSTLNVDAQAPSFGTVEDAGNNPVAGNTLSTSTPTLTVPVSDDRSVDPSGIVVDLSQGDTEIVHKVNEPASDTDGITYASGVLTIDTSSSEIPELPDGQIDLSVEAADTADNTNTKSVSFTVDTASDLTFEMTEPTPGATVGNAQQSVEVTINGNDDTVDDSSAAITLTGAGNTELTRSSSAVEYNSQTNTFTVTPSSDLSDGPVTVEVSASDSQGNPASETFEFEIDTTGPQVASISLAKDRFEFGNSPAIDLVEANPTEAETGASIDSQEIVYDVEGLAVDGDTDVVFLEFADEFPQSGNVGVNGVSLQTTDGGDAQSSITSSSEVVDGPDNDGVDDTIRFATDAKESSLRITVDAAVTYPDSSRYYGVETIVDNSDGSILRGNVVALKSGTPGVGVNTDEVTFTPTFSEPVDADSVEASLTIDGDSITVTDFTDADSDPTTVTASVSTDQEIFQDVDTESESLDPAAFEITAAEDTVTANALRSSAANPRKFTVDTLAPSVAESESRPDVISGYADLTSFITIDAEDDASITYEITPGESLDPGDEFATPDAVEDYDTRNLVEGEQTLQVDVSDEVFNFDRASIPFEVDNTDPTIEYAGPDSKEVAASISNEAANNAESLSQFFAISDAGTYRSDVTYAYKGPEMDSFQPADRLLFYRFPDEAKIDVKATVPDTGGQTVSETVTLTNQLPSGEHDIAMVQGRTAEGEDTMYVFAVSDERLRSVSVDVAADDQYFASSPSQTLTRSDFTERRVETENGPNFLYQATLTPERDGLYQADVTAVNGAGFTEEDFGTYRAAWNTGLPEITDAYVSGRGITNSDPGLYVTVEFDEPVQDVDPSDFVVEDNRGGEVVSIDGDGSTGRVEVDFDREFQTRDAPEIVIPEVGDIQSRFGPVFLTVEEHGGVQSTDSISTVHRELDEGVNLVSVPAETGERQLDDVELSSEVQVIWAYEDGEWKSYVPGADGNDLEALKGGQGYYVRTTGETTLELNVYNVPTATSEGAPMAPTSQRLEAGWNLVGHYQENTQPAGAALPPYDPDQGYYNGLRVLGPDRPNSADSEYPTFVDVNALEPEKAYWVFVPSENAPAQYAPRDEGYRQK